MLTKESAYKDLQIRGSVPWADQALIESTLDVTFNKTLVRHVSHHLSVRLCSFSSSLRLVAYIQWVRNNRKTSAPWGVITPFTAVAIFNTYKPTHYPSSLWLTMVTKASTYRKAHSMGIQKRVGIFVFGIGIQSSIVGENFEKLQSTWSFLYSIKPLAMSFIKVKLALDFVSLGPLFW